MKLDSGETRERVSVSSILQGMYGCKKYQQYMPSVIGAIRNDGDLSLFARRGGKRGFNVAQEDIEDFKRAVEEKVGGKRHRESAAINFRGEYDITGPQITRLYKRLNEHPELEEYRMPSGRGGYLYRDSPLVREVAEKILREIGMSLKEKNPDLGRRLLGEVAPINHILVTNQSDSDIYREEMSRQFRVHPITSGQRERERFSKEHDVNCLQPNPLTIPPNCDDMGRCLRYMVGDQIGLNIMKERLISLRKKGKGGKVI